MLSGKLLKQINSRLDSLVWFEKKCAKGRKQEENTLINISSAEKKSVKY